MPLLTLIFLPIIIYWQAWRLARELSLSLHINHHILHTYSPCLGAFVIYLDVSTDKTPRHAVGIGTGGFTKILGLLRGCPVDDLNLWQAIKCSNDVVPQSVQYVDAMPCPSASFGRYSKAARTESRGVEVECSGCQRKQRRWRSPCVSHALARRLSSVIKWKSAPGNSETQKPKTLNRKPWLPLPPEL